MSYERAVRALSPRAYWTLQGSWPDGAKDLSGNGYHAISLGGSIASLSDALMPRGDVAEYSWDLDGVNGTHINFPTAAIDMSGAFSFCFWAKPDAIAGGLNDARNLFGKVDNAGSSLPHAGNVYVYTVNGGSEFVMKPTLGSPNITCWIGTYVVGTPYFIAITCTAGTNPTCTSYVNGVQSWQTAMTGLTTRGDNGDLRFGAMEAPYWNGAWSGKVSHIATWNRVLSAAEVKSMWDAAQRNGVVIG